MSMKKAYACVQCQQYHYEGDDQYEPHIMFQSKHGIQWFPDPDAQTPKPVIVDKKTDEKK